MTICEDAPCCGCCGTNLYGGNESRDYYDEPHQDDYYDHDDYDPECEPGHACDGCDGPSGQWVEGVYVLDGVHGWECSYCDRPCPEGAHAD